MNCTNCGFPIENGVGFCTNCGAKASNETVNNTAPAGDPYNYQGGAGYDNYAQGNNHGGYDPYMNQAPVQPPYAQPYNYRDSSERVPTMGDYIKWMFLYPLFNLIPIVGFIVYIVMCIKNAFDTSFKARANYFKAMLVVWAISIVLMVVMFILMFTVFGASFAAGIDYFENSDIFEGLESGYYAFISLIR